MRGVFALVVILSLASQCHSDAGSGCDCLVEHPQEIICTSDFAFSGTILTATALKGVYHYEVGVKQLFKGHDLIEYEAGLILDVYTPYMTGLCGRSNLIPQTGYLLSGSYLEGRFVITLCDWVAEWGDVTPNQKKYLKEKKYIEHCSMCSIIGVKVKLGRNQMEEEFEFSEHGSGLWSPYGCHFNPVQSIIYSEEDCETSYSYCRVSDRQPDVCDWERSPDYEECFGDREAAWSSRERPGPAAALIDPQRPADCRRLESKKMKKKCLRRLRENMKANKGEMEPAEMLLELMEIRDLFLDDELFDD